MTLSERALIHADNMQSEGWYTTANVLAECAEVLERLRGALQKIVETTDDGCVEELAERALAFSPANPTEDAGGRQDG